MILNKIKIFSLIIVGFLAVCGFSSTAFAYDYITGTSSASIVYFGTTDNNFSFNGSEFTPTSTETFDVVTAILGGASNYEANPDRGVALYIYSVSSPTNIGTLFAVSATTTIDVANNATSTFDFVFASPVTFTSGVTYLMLLRSSNFYVGNTNGINTYAAQGDGNNKYVSSANTGFPTTYRYLTGGASSARSLMFKTRLDTPTNQDTTIISVSPATNDVVATSTLPISFDFELYVDEFDVDVSYFEYCVSDLQGQASALTPVLPCSFYFKYPLTATGTINISTTTTSISEIGSYMGSASIKRQCEPESLPWWSSIIPNASRDANTNCPDVVTTGTARRVDYFAIGADTYIGSLSREFQEGLDTLYFSTTSTSTLFARCDDILFGTDPLTDCLISLVIPSSAQVAALLDINRQPVLNKAPWGFAFRSYYLLSSDYATATLPVVNPTFPDSFGGGLAGKSVDFTPWDKLMGSGSIVGDASFDEYDQSFMSSLLEYWETLCKIAFVIFLLAEFMGAWNRGDIQAPRTVARAISRGDHNKGEFV